MLPFLCLTGVFLYWLLLCENDLPWLLGAERCGRKTAAQIAGYEPLDMQHISSGQMYLASQA